MSSQLPHDLITRVKPLLVPFVQNKDEREALFIETFFLRDPRPLQLNFEASNADVFATKCIADLIQKVGCLAESDSPQHSLAALLQTVRPRWAADETKQAEVDYWQPILNDQCLTSTVEPPRAEPVSKPPQSTDTPLSERTASVFVSYSHADDKFANQLIADLQTVGHQCWIDTSQIKGGADWQRAICDGINQSYALIVVCTHQSLHSEYVWDEIQWARTRHKLIIPVLREDVIDDDRFFGLHRYQGIRFDKLAHSQAMTLLVAALPTPPQIDPSQPIRMPSRREHELAYLDRLRFDDFRLEKFELADYASLGGMAQTRSEQRDSWEALAMRQEFALIPDLKRDSMEHDAAPVPFTDAVSKITELKRVVVLGEPGAGKTHTLRAVAKPLYTAALSNPDAPIPLLVKLGNWDQPDEPFEHFLRYALGELGDYIDELFAEKRAILLLDGINEFPAYQRTSKYPQVKAYINSHPDVMAVVTCREADYPISLHLSKVLIRPLDPLRIRDFARRALNAIESDDAFFWNLVEADARRFESRFRERFEDELPEWESIFWVATTLPDQMEWKEERINTIYYGWNRWLALRDDPSSILTLARNPYMLRMLTDVHIQFKGELPPNRGQLFSQFVSVLLKREKLVKIDEVTGVISITDEGQALLIGLQQIAFEMQIRRANPIYGILDAGTSLPLESVRRILNERLLYLAVSTSLITTGAEVRFSHQLLQEYFAARYMDEAIRNGRLNAQDIWKADYWWERTNWEEAAILLVGMFPEHIDWVASANPEVAGQCIAHSGAVIPQETLDRYRHEWIPRLTDLKRDPEPLARAAIGRGLALANLDNRRGVGLNANGLPDIIWCEVAAGEFIYQEDEKLSLPTFSISKYPITYKQFQAFIDDEKDGYKNAKWGDGLHEKGLTQQQADVGDQAYKYWNHPCECVSWYEAMAYSRWLSSKLDYEVTLPTEQQWEKAARGTDGRMYPYGDEFDPTKSNTEKTVIVQTSAVGMFPNGASPYGVEDMSGNVWEWCLNDYDKMQVNISSNNIKTLRGGSWVYGQDRSRAAFRDCFSPDFRYLSIGFRLVCASPSSY